jgi:NAD(P)-dependent dehydrogenase (short-subunit alcohol dehydrogenase family)
VATDYDASLLSDLDGCEGYLAEAFDVSSDEAANRVAKRIRAEVGRLDVIVNNAGVMSFYPVSEAPTSMTVAAFSVNTFGPLRTVRACLDLLIESRGRIVNISSESAPLRTPFQSYASSKMALEALSDVLRRELQLFGVHVAIVRPGAIGTELLEDVQQVRNELQNSRFDKFFRRFAAGVAKRIPKHPSTPAEVAEVVFAAATDEKRRVLYRVNNDRVLRILSWLPAGLTDRILAGNFTR